MACKGWTRVLLFGLMLLGLTVHSVAQDDGEDADDTTNVRTAYVSLTLDTRGGAELDVTLDRKADSWNAIRSALNQGLHCPEAQLASPGEPETKDIGRRMSPKQKERYLRQVAEFNQRRLHVHCASVLSRDRSLVVGDFDAGPLIASLQQLDLQRLALYIYHPRTAFADASPRPSRNDSDEDFVSTPYDPKSTYLAYRFSLTDTRQPSRLHLVYGFREQDLQYSFATLAGFILLPLGLMLWMRRSALRGAKNDAVAASFSYFRALNWCSTGAILLWVVSGLGARQSLQDWIHFLSPTGWKPALEGILIILGPAWLVYFLCVAISYPVFVQLRGNTSTRREFLLQHLAAVGAQVLPLSFLFAGIELFTQNPRLATGFFAAAYFSRLICTSWQLKLSKTLPQILSTGELRDRLFALAQKAGVRVQQVMIMPAGKGQMANAFASRNNLVIFTDYLLQRLSKREVDAVAAHELTHLRHRHPMKLQCALLAVIFAPSWFNYVSQLVMSLVMIPLALLRDPVLISRIYASVLKFETWSQRDLVLILAGWTGFYFLSRRFEHTADAGAVALTGDPEAKISALLKLNRLNLMPIQWDKVTGSWLTHPSTLHRVERIAAEANMPQEQLREILDRHTAQQQGSRTADTVGARESEPHYDVPAVTDPDRIRTATQRMWRMRFTMWTLLIMHSLPAAAVAWLVATKHWEGTRLLLAYFAGIALTIALVTWAGLALAVVRLARQKRLLVEQLRRKDVSIGSEAIAVGFSPDATARFYGSHQFNWDVGMLTLVADRLTYIGEQTQFCLTSDKIVASALGPGSPSWWKIPRLFVQWKDPQNGREGVFNLCSLEACSTWQFRSQNRLLADRLLLWRSQASTSSTPTSASDLQSPSIGKLTSISPRDIGKFRRFSRVSIMLLMVAVGMCLALRIQATGYVCSVALLCQMFGLIPYWRYRETRFAAPAVSSTVGTLASAAGVGGPAS